MSASACPVAPACPSQALRPVGQIDGFIRNALVGTSEYFAWKNLPSARAPEGKPVVAPRHTVFTNKTVSRRAGKLDVTNPNYQLSVGGTVSGGCICWMMNENGIDTPPALHAHRAATL